MKLAIVTSKFCKGDGQGRVNYEIVHEALRQGYGVTLIASEIADELKNNPLVKSILFPVAQYPTALLQNQVFAWQTAHWLKTHRLEYDLLQVNGFNTWTPGDVNAVHFVHSAWLRSPVHSVRIRRDLQGLYQWLYTTLNARLERKAFSEAKVVIAVSEQVRQDLLDMGVPSQKIKVILNGVDLQEFHPGPVSRRELKLPEGVPLALFAGEIRTPRKNLDTVLHALVKVSDLHLMIAGSVEGSPYPALSEQLGLTERVHFLGYRRDVAELMRAADFFVFPSRYEACSLVLLEALASGLPVITARTAGGAEVVTPDCGIVLSDPNDAQALAAAMRDLVENSDKCHAMKFNARQTAEQHGWGQMAGAYLNVCQFLLEETRAMQPLA